MAGRRAALAWAIALGGVGALPVSAEPLLTLVAGAATLEVPRAAVTSIDISESGGITDIFVRLGPSASEGLAGLTEGSAGARMQVMVCGAVMLDAPARDRIGSGTIYIPGTNAVRAEALRAVWQGRASCDTLAPEVFEHGN
ncbi:hypothetical protein P6F26_00445 [Roseibacterium sp. SDUM158017]|uniref:hypothetical protein n=1 Tax=Roseicyclus salinarum TaxID=3036773 RepID=UPI002414FA3B|nr:hypothetical protein [Roseibacterium sp. SDUM158017]MDG4646898.1 hypothetical protein [Roseibacterium sp. SDUM158017]